MHFHAEHTIFFEDRKPLSQVALSLGFTLCVLILNAGAGNTTLSMTFSGVGILLLIHAYISGTKRVEPLVAWTLTLIVCVMLGGVVIKGSLVHLADIIARIFCGVIWVLWLGSQIDWASLRQILLILRVPKVIVATLDRAITHGV